MQTIILCEKHGTRVVEAGHTEADLHATALALLKERLTEGWYFNWDDGDPRHRWEDRAKKIAGSANIELAAKIAWRFLNERKGHEYEGLELQTIVAPDPHAEEVEKLRELLGAERYDRLLTVATNFTGCRKPLRLGLDDLLERMT